jgi:soluble lytic murein transglycosylase
MIRFLLFFIPIFIWAIPSLDEVLNYPHTYFRDFYLTQYLKKVKKLEDADKIYNEITYKKRKHLYILSKKFLKYKKIYNCKYPNRFNFKNISYKCILKNGFRLSDLKKMKKNDIKYLIDSIPNSDIKLEICSFFFKNYKPLFRNKNAFFDFFLQIPVNIDIPSLYLNNLAKDKRFYYFLNFIIRKHNFNILKKSLLNIDYFSLNDKEKFLLALNAINFNYIAYAVNILKSIQNKNDKDIFWLYLLTKNKKYADKLLNNKRLDFYTLYIYEKFHKKYKLDNVIIFNTSKVIYNINNPLDVIKFNIDYSYVKNYFKFAKKLDNTKMLPLKTLVLDKAFKFQKNYYIMPKYNLDDLNMSSKALFFALARQESRFIPAQISHSYAIGLMQMMPFLIRSFHPKEDISKFFEADTNIKYAKKHLLWLAKRLNHPLFIAYAYNGGIGFTKRKVIPFFKFKGFYEPFLSMEMVPYTESREYGKKVITNYIIYYNKLGGNITLHKLFKYP